MLYLFKVRSALQLLALRRQARTRGPRIKGESIHTGVRRLLDCHHLDSLGKLIVLCLYRACGASELLFSQPIDSTTHWHHPT
jgi:hypothetical protein